MSYDYPYPIDHSFCGTQSPRVLVLKVMHASLSKPHLLGLMISARSVVNEEDVPQSVQMVALLLGKERGTFNELLIYYVKTRLDDTHSIHTALF